MSPTMKIYSHALALGLAAALTTGCPESEPPEEDTQETDEGAAECDPVGEIPQVGELYNAPLEADVEVVVKTPQHPGAPGPRDLP